MIGTVIGIYIFDTHTHTRQCIRPLPQASGPCWRMVPADAPVEQYSYTLFVPKTKEAEFSSCAERSAHASRASRCFESIEMLREHLFQPRSLRILDFEILICQFVVNLPSCITYTYIHIFNTQPDVSIYRCCRCRSF